MATTRQSDFPIASERFCARSQARRRQGLAAHCHACSPSSRTPRGTEHWITPRAMILVRNDSFWDAERRGSYLRGSCQSGLAPVALTWDWDCVSGVHSGVIGRDGGPALATHPILEVPPSKRDAVIADGYGVVDTFASTGRFVRAANYQMDAPAATAPDGKS